MFKHTFFIHLNATPAWLALSRRARSEYIAQQLFPVFARFPAVNVRFFDGEYFSAQVSDIIMLETNDLPSYYALIDAIRDSEVIQKPYFTVAAILPTVESSLESYEAAPAQGSELLTIPL